MRAAPARGTPAAAAAKRTPAAARTAQQRPTSRFDVYKDVRALSRGLAIISALGDLGWVKLGKLSAHTAIDRTTVYRLVKTLLEAGYVSRRDEDGAVGLSWKLLQITKNLRDSELVAQIVMRHLSPLTRAIKWPSDFAVVSGGRLYVAASTHSMSPMSIHRAMVGKTRPLFRSAVGKALLSAMPKPELRELLTIIKRVGSPDAKDATSLAAVEYLIAEVREKGYAAAIGTTEPNFSAIALPLRGSGSVVGAINIIFFRKAMSPEAAAERYLPLLRKCVADIEADLAGRLPESGSAGERAADPQAR